MAFVADVCRQTGGRTTLVVALLIFRRTKIYKTQTVTVPGEELAAFGIDRVLKFKALARLERAGFVRLDEKTGGRSTRVTLLWRPE